MARSDERLGSRPPQAALRKQPSLTRRSFAALLAAPLLSLRLAPRLSAEKGRTFPGEIVRYPDPSTELDVYRLTSPAVSSFLPPPFQRAIARRGAFLLYASDRAASGSAGGSEGLQVFRLDLKTGESSQISTASALDPTSITLLPGERSCCYFDGPVLRQGLGVERELYRVPEGWERTPGFAVTDDGTHAVFAEKQGAMARLRRVSLVKAPPATVFESEGEISLPLPRPRRAQILYRKDGALWLVNLDGQQNHRLKTESCGPALWTPSGRTIVYLHFPEDATQLNTLRELTPDENADRLLAKTSQFAAFGENGDSSVFVGASRNKASQTVLLLLRAARREFTLCEHKASDPAMVQPVFAPDSQSVFFQSDRHGKPAIYRIKVEKLVEET
jgi:oligogalacturonide lyase